MTTTDIATVQLPFIIHFPKTSIEIVSAEVCASYWEGTAGDYRETAVAGIASPTETALVHSLHSPGAAQFALLHPAPEVAQILPFIIRKAPKSGKGISVLIPVIRTEDFSSPPPATAPLIHYFPLMMITSK